MWVLVNELVLHLGGALVQRVASVRIGLAFLRTYRIWLCHPACDSKLVKWIAARWVLWQSKSQYWTSYESRTYLLYHSYFIGHLFQHRNTQNLTFTAKEGRHKVRSDYNEQCHLCMNNATSADQSIRASRSIYAYDCWDWQSAWHLLLHRKVPLKNAWLNTELGGLRVNQHAQWVCTRFQKHLIYASYLEL